MQNIKELTFQAINTAIGAGKEILKVYSSEYEVEQKADDSPLTTADKKAHDYIFENLQSTEIPMLSEEGKDIEYTERSVWKKFWLVDPLDGTKEFIKRNGEFTVNIALVEDQKPIAGIIYIPVLDVLYFGAKGLGSFKTEGASRLANKKAPLEDIILVSHQLPLLSSTDKYVVVGSRSHMSPETEAFINKIREEKGEIEIASRGSSLKFCMIAEGKAQIYPRFAPTMEWDTAAGQAIVEQAGGKVMQSKNNQQLIYNKEELRNPWFIVER
ncbi:MAG: 3'(2'),5'-bisphosphate nucleotidase CysQ [Bacteroidales bacterium]|nr:3'(2'),5'-bisphosphate nucleotidase CysQ [Bacteroidales bacterium]